MATYDIFHITSRGRRRRAIFRDDEDRQLLLRLCASAVEKYGIAIHAYCLMENHYHLITEAQFPVLSRAMQLINGGYSRAFRKENPNWGPLFEGPYNKVEIKGEEQFLETARYIVLNPVRAKLIKRPVEFIWSSYRATAGIEHPPIWLTTGKILSIFKNNAKCYMEYVEKGITKRNVSMFGVLPPLKQ